jgi:hypothetical protein
MVLACIEFDLAQHLAIVPMRDMRPFGRMCVIRGPAGAVAALIQPAN